MTSDSSRDLKALADDIFQAMLRVPPQDDYCVVDAVVDGKRKIGEYNRGYRDYDLKKLFPWCLRLAIVLDENNILENGLPLPNELQIAFEIQEQLTTAIADLTYCRYVGHLFFDGFLDVYLYLHKPEEVHEFLEAHLDDETYLRNYAYEINGDPQWTVYHDLNPGRPNQAL